MKTLRIRKWYKLQGNTPSVTVDAARLSVDEIKKVIKFSQKFQKPVKINTQNLVPAIPKEYFAEYEKLIRATGRKIVVQDELVFALKNS